MHKMIEEWKILDKNLEILKKFLQNKEIMVEQEI